MTELTREQVEELANARMDGRVADALLNHDAALRTRLEAVEEDNVLLKEQFKILNGSVHIHYEEKVALQQQLSTALARVKELEARIEQDQGLVRKINTLTTRLAQAEHDAKGARECNQRQAEEITELRRDRTQVEEACRNYAEWFDSDIAKSIWPYLTIHGWKDLGPVVTHEVNKQALHPAAEKVPYE